MAADPERPGSPFEIRLPGRPDTLRVVSFHAVEEASRLTRLHVRVTAADTSQAQLASLLGEPIVLTFLDDGAPLRTLAGIVARAETSGTVLHDRQVLSLTCVPSFWRLTRRRTRRIFQDLSSAEIAALLLAEWGVPFRFELPIPPRKRGVAVQYDESDHAFLSRLFAEDGLHTTFDAPLDLDAATPETLVLRGPAAPLLDIHGDPLLSLDRRGGAGAMRAREDHVHAFSFRHRARSSATLVRGHDFRIPDTDLRDTAAVPGLPQRPQDRSVVVEHEGSYEDDIGSRPARLRLQEERVRAEMAQGASSCRRLQPLRRFVLRGHEVASLDGPYVVTRVEHEGWSAEAAPEGRPLYENRFDCAPAHVPLVPRRRRPRPRQVAETARVVGPPGQPIYTDAFGRIKVQFQWDLEGRLTERSSCWIRVATAWAGHGWGTQLIPRVGMEVIVTYLDGDLDRPLVTGCVYNGTHPVPFPLPMSATRSGIRTQSSPGQEGGNELSFEDASGSEQVYLHAQRNYDEVIEANRGSRIGGVSETYVGGSLRERVAGFADIGITGGRTVHVHGEERVSVGQNAHVEIAGDHQVLIAGSEKKAVVGAVLLEARSGHSTVVGTDTGEKPTAQSDLYVFGSHAVGAKGRITLRADEGLTLQCGETSIEIHPNKLVLSSPTIETKVTKALVASAKDGPVITVADDVEILAKKVRVFTKSAALELDSEVKLKGDKIHLGYKPNVPSSKDESATPETKPLTLRLTDWFLDPYAHKKYHLLVEGLRFEGETDGEGSLKQDIPKAATQATVRLWLDAYPEGRQRVYQLALGEIPPVSETKGAKQRLKNLGYFTGPVNGVPDGHFSAAVMAFQADHMDTHGLEKTGELDTGTAGALEEIHGS